MKTRENQLLYWFHPSFSFATEWTHFFPPAAPFQQVLDVQAYMRTDACACKRCSNIEHNLNADARSEHMAAARRAGRCEAVQRSVGGAQGSRIPGSQVPPPAFNSVFPSTSSTVTCKLGKNKNLILRAIWRWTYPFMRENYLFFAWSISMRRVAWGAFPCMCLKYKKSSPRWAIDLRTQRSLRISGFFVRILPQLRDLG